MILDEIIKHKREEVALQKQAVPLPELRSRLKDASQVRDFSSALLRAEGEPLRIIAEVKKASPSKGVIREDFDPVEIARIYESNGASAISVLTDEKYFQGSLGYLIGVKSAVKLPVLRKDFIVDEYQIFQSRAAGADAILLIVATLTEDELKSYLAVAGELGLHCLVEVHDGWELDIAIAAGARIIGVNNRNLKTFNVDVSTTTRLIPRMPNGAIVVSESGIRSKYDIQFLADKGAHAALIGEALMRSPDIGAKLREFVL
ncbi:MAG: indole-3-glycerol phosphate synthase TrpC [Armatimonadota bacterium]|nr:indole-3-glycerol phosphate synthase TrpC [Armatimonadota bacterium]